MYKKVIEEVDKYIEKYIEDMRSTVYRDAVEVEPAKTTEIFKKEIAVKEEAYINSLDVKAPDDVTITLIRTIKGAPQEILVAKARDFPIEFKVPPFVEGGQRIMIQATHYYDKKVKVIFKLETTLLIGVETVIRKKG